MATPAARVAGPLRDDQANELARLVQGFSLDQLTWTSGYLAGLANAAPVAEAQPTAAATITLLYGSQTGNGRDVAERLAEAAAGQGVTLVPTNMADYKPARLKREETVFVVVSTHGEGDPPEDAEALYEFLHSARAPRLDTLSYAVLALGDSSYEHFCKTGRDFDERLAALGATRLHERVDCDVDYDEPAGRWTEAVVAEAAARAATTSTDAGSSVVRLHPVATSPAYGRRNPFPAPVLVNQRITMAPSEWSVNHLELSLEDSGLAYQPGDSIGVVTTNPPATVAALVDALGLSTDAPVTVDGADTDLATALTESLEVTGLGRSFVEKYAAHAGSDELSALLAPERRGDLAAWMAARQVVDVVRAHPAALTPQQFVETLRKLTPRLYSIASGPSANPDEVHATVAAVRYDAFGAVHEGAASTFIADRLAAGDELPLYIEPNERFRLPDDPDAPVIMIGPGTGVAPFRAFVEERGALGARGRNWLLFGARNFATDFLYQVEWLRHRKAGLLTRLDLAFSRDQATKVYVQHRLREHGAELYAWLEEGAHVYVCGDATAMAADVHAALEDVICEHGNPDRDAAAQYLKDLKDARRYQRDVY